MQTLDAVSTVSFTAASISEHMVDGQKTIHAIVPTSEFLHAEIPNKANSRNFTGTKNKSVEEMIKTLKTEPEMFRLKNLGIRMVASDYTRNGNNLVLYFGEDEGIFNGGHTYTVLKTYGRKKAFVSVNIDLQLPKEKLVDISLALNMSKKLEAISQGEKKGAFDWVKEALPKESIIYKEGDNGEFPIDDVLKVANLFKIGKGKQYLETALSQSIRSKATIIKENNNKQSLIYTKWLLPDVWELYKELRTNKKIISTLPPHFSKKDHMLQGMALCFIAGVRYTTEINKNMIPAWKESFNKEEALKLCEKVSKQVAKELKKSPYKDMKAEAVYRDSNFQLLMKVIFADALS